MFTIKEVLNFKRKSKLFSLFSVVQFYQNKGPMVISRQKFQEHFTEIKKLGRPGIRETKVVDSRKEDFENLGFMVKTKTKSSFAMVPMLRPISTLK